MKILKTVSTCLFAVVIIGLLIAGLFGWQAYRFWFQQPAPNADVVEFVVEEGASFKDTATALREADLVANAFWFRVYGRLDGSARQIKAGVFELMPGSSYKSLIDVLIQAKSDEVTITIPEGYRLDQIGEVAMEHFDVTEAEWGLAAGVESPLEEHSFVKAAQKPDNVDLEGYLFPDTYRFFRDATAEDIVGTMVDTLEARFEEPDAGVSGRFESIHEVLTLASIVEREVRGEKDMKLVADIFQRRLEMGMALQADSTVNYITGKKTPGISLADRDIESPYNTYKNPGLPPGPISSPGLAAINAVLNPTPNSFLFFLTTPEGEVIYSLTHDAHVRNKARYLD